ncbi:MAG: hypothetical protein K0V04_12320 [Deltaproteobacteria bacterium]|nr:hypothetical protein [Deltaproteobacteria bacterium]
MAYAVILGAVMLVPHCICDNFLNHYWIASIGASPLCFFLFYATVLLTAAGLRGVRPRLALLCSVGAVISVSAIGLGHALFAFPW